MDQIGSNWIKLDQNLITYVIPDVSGTKAPQPKNGGTDIQNVYNQMPPIIVNELLKDVILYFSGLVMVKSR